MNYEQFTLKTQDALQSATALAQASDHSEVGAEHILSCLLEQKDGIVPPLVERIGVSVQALLALAESDRRTGEMLRMIK